MAIIAANRNKPPIPADVKQIVVWVLPDRLEEFGSKIEAHQFAVRLADGNPERALPVQRRTVPAEPWDYLTDSERAFWSAKAQQIAQAISQDNAEEFGPLPYVPDRGHADIHMLTLRLQLKWQECSVIVNLITGRCQLRIHGVFRDASGLAAIATRITRASNIIGRLTASGFIPQWSANTDPAWHNLQIANSVREGSIS